MGPTTEEVEEYQDALHNVQRACELIWQEMLDLQKHPGCGTGPLYPNPHGGDRWKPVLDARDEPEAIREMRRSIGKGERRRKAACGALAHYVIAVNLRAMLYSYRAGKRTALFAHVASLKRDLILVFNIRMHPNLQNESLDRLVASLRSRCAPIQA